MSVPLVENKSTQSSQTNNTNSSTTNNQTTSCYSTCKSCIDPVYNLCPSFFDKVTEYAVWIKDLIVRSFTSVYEMIFGKTEAKKPVMQPSEAVFDFSKVTKNLWPPIANDAKNRIETQSWQELEKRSPICLIEFFSNNFMAYLRAEGVTDQKEIKARLPGLYSSANQAFFELMVRAFEHQGLLKK